MRRVRRLQRGERRRAVAEARMDECHGVRRNVANTCALHQFIQDGAGLRRSSKLAENVGSRRKWLAVSCGEPVGVEQRREREVVLTERRQRLSEHHVADPELPIDHKRAAVPLLHEPAATIERELQLVRPYLELMQMRMPDRLQYAMNVDPEVLQVRCPPTTLLTLVENAVRHGIDPSEEGGRIDIDIVRIGERCVVRVTDTGVGLHQSADGLGIGLTALRERLRLIFGDAAHLRLTANAPRGAAVEIDMPAQTGAPDTRSLRVGVEP